VHKRIISAVKRVECHVIVLNVHGPTEDKTDDVKDSFYENWNVCSINSLITI
jgi:hypothetical protein